jgi:hypothetical protein
LSDLDVIEPGTAGGHGGGTPPWLRTLVGQQYILTKAREVKRLSTVMNYAQIDFIDECQRQLETTGQIRICVLKARQIGISTIIEAIMFVLTMIYDDFKVMIISHEADSAEGILNMTQRYWSLYPGRDLYTEKYSGKKHLSWETDSGIQVATAKNVDAGRSKTLQALHASEVAFWDEPAVLMTGLRQSIPTYGITCIFLESTANGVGNYFHSECMAAMKGESDYVFKFYPWWKHPEYTASYIAEDQRVKHVSAEGLSEDERDEEARLVRDFGLSQERLIWRRWAIKNLCQGDVEKFHQEYPSTPHEAFISTGRNVWKLNNLLNHYVPRKGQRGVLARNSRTGKIDFHPHERGWITLYQYPSKDKSWGVYLVGGDPTHTTAGDNAVMQVINRRTREVVATYRNKIAPIAFGKHMQLVGHYYNDALLVPENEGPGYATVGCLVADNYPNIYKHEDVAKQPGHPQEKYGWSTNVKTKELAVAHITAAISEPLASHDGNTYGLVIHDEITLMELRDYVTKEDGHGYENSDGSPYDDGVMALGIALTADAIEPSPPPYVAVPMHEQPKPPPRAVIIPDQQIRGAIIESSGSVGPEPDPNVPDDPGPAPMAPWEAWGNRRDND